MKVTPVPAGQGGMSVPGTSTTLNTSRPTAVPLPTTSVDPSVEEQREAAKTRTIKMRVQQTPGSREYSPADAGGTAALDAAAATPATAPAATPEALAVAPTAPAVPATPTATATEANPALRSSTEQAQAAAEDTKPLSPQQVALARQRRALMLKERELQVREKALAEKTQVPPAQAAVKRMIDVARLKSEPLSVLQEEGVTYEQLTEAILNGKAVDPEVSALKREVAALKEGIDQKLEARDRQAEKAALDDMERTAHRLARQGDDFALVRETRSVPKVRELIARTWEKTGEILDVPEAMRLVEEDLVSETLRVAAINKVQGKLAPKPAAPPQASAPATPPAPGIKTLTNRDTSTVPLSRKERAMQAFYGGKK
jgi:hypothetical protein